MRLRLSSRINAERNCSSSHTAMDKQACVCSQVSVPVWAWSQCRQSSFFPRRYFLPHRSGPWAISPAGRSIHAGSWLKSIASFSETAPGRRDASRRLLLAGMRETHRPPHPAAGLRRQTQGATGTTNVKDALAPISQITGEIQLVKYQELKNRPSNGLDTLSCCSQPYTLSMTRLTSVVQTPNPQPQTSDGHLRLSIEAAIEQRKPYLRW